MKALIFGSLFILTIELAVAQNQSNKKVKQALKEVKSDLKSLRKLKVTPEFIQTELSKCKFNQSGEPVQFAADSAVEFLTSILIRKLCYDVTVIYENLTVSKLNGRQLRKVIRNFNNLKDTRTTSIRSTK